MLDNSESEKAKVTISFSLINQQYNIQIENI